MDFDALLATDCVTMDVGFENLRCAHGLPGTEKIDLDQCHRLLDRWAEYVEDFTTRNWYRFKRKPGDFWDSPAKFRMLVMMTALQRDLGVSYCQKCSEDPLDYTDAAPWFICGPMIGRGGS